jgi:hypothetical protein
MIYYKLGTTYYSSKKTFTLLNNNNYFLKIEFIIYNLRIITNTILYVNN